MTVKPHPKNAPGDFYVKDGGCIACGVPLVEAPSLMAWEGSHCYFARQPADDDQLDEAVAALIVSCSGCVRYGGQDPTVRKRLAEASVGELCDKPYGQDVPAVQRLRAGFDCALSVEELLARLSDGLRRKPAGAPDDIRVEGGRLICRWSGREHSIEAGPAGPGRLELRFSSASLAMETWPALKKAGSSFSWDPDGSPKPF